MLKGMAELNDLGSRSLYAWDSFSALLIRFKTWGRDYVINGQHEKWDETCNINAR
jgi:hypothetical protein